MDELDVMEQRELERFASFALWGATEPIEALRDHWQCVKEIWGLMTSQGWEVGINATSFMSDPIRVAFGKPHYLGQAWGDTLKIAMLKAAIRAEQCPRLEEAIK